MSDKTDPIADETDLYRRVHPTQVVYDENVDRVVATSNAFKDPEMSVNVADDIERIGETPEYAVRKYPKHHLVAINSGFARSLDQDVRRDPILAGEANGVEGDQTHGLVLGKKTTSIARKFAKHATDRWVIFRDGDDESESAGEAASA